ncbi:hypothetical protein BDV23DRAFT_189457 [Aspergillus alliaceus]|uniref:Uncharacterized protein n=1 Tax=Petromyces alliaceus TaxID=209559 RepID=A0A5N7BQS0_PETAA|nr:hypothetical protein BDV23DRAFT_189457 [Aspergillus alliaceus]
MYTLWILLFPILLVSYLAAAKCYKVPARSNKLVPQDHLQTICTGLQGNYQKKEPRDACITDKATGTEWRFYMEQTGDNNVLTYTTCIAAFKQELRKCKNGAGHYNNDK